jgi:hypothetical protein
MQARGDGGAMEFAAGGLEEDILDEGGLAGAGDAGDDGEEADGEACVEVLEVVLASALDFDPAVGGESAVGGDGDGFFAGEVLTREGAGVGLELGGGSGGGDASAVRT